MDRTDSFFTIKAPAEIEIKIKGSRFIARAFPCSDQPAAETILESIRKKYYDATHHCFAFRVGLNENQKFRYSDAGEPTGTAGKPIYDQIDGRNLTNLIIIVTRYFGGTKLGTGGLTHAYSDAASDALAKAGIIEQFITRRLTLPVPYSDYNLVERTIHKFNGIIVNRDLAREIPLITVQIRQSLCEPFRLDIIEVTSGRVKFEIPS